MTACKHQSIKAEPESQLEQEWLPRRRDRNNSSTSSFRLRFDERTQEEAAAAPPDWRSFGKHLLVQPPGDEEVLPKAPRLLEAGWKLQRQQRNVSAGGSEADSQRGGGVLLDANSSRSSL